MPDETDQGQESAARQKTVGRVIARAWTDGEYRRRLVANPETVLTEAGLKPEPGVKYQVVEDSTNQRYLVLPSRPDGLPSRELSDAELEHVAGGLETALVVDWAIRFTQL